MMKFDPIVEEYFETRPEFLSEIEAFEKRRGLSLLKKLIKDKDEINFFSWLSEIRFGLFFDKISDDLKNDYVIQKKKPDWMININGQEILIEVLRLNSPEEEQRNIIEKSRQLRKLQKDNPQVPLVSRGSTNIISLEFLGGAQSKLERKEEKYREIVRKHKLPFIICVATTLDTYLFESDLFDFLMGSKGFYKSDENFGRSVTGVLLNTPFDKFFYYHNEHSEFHLAQKNIDTLFPFYYTIR